MKTSQIVEKKELEKLEKELKISKQKTYALRDRIEKAKLTLALPVLRKKYNGTYWKYKNSSAENDWWWIYIRCDDVVEINRFLGAQFQMCNIGRNDFDIGEFGFYLLNAGIKISKSEYQLALIKFTKEVAKLRS